MSVATTTAIAIGAGVAAAGSVGGAVIAGHDAKSAASTQANAAMSAQQLQAQEAQNALDFQKQEFNTNQQNLAPWLQSGKEGLANLDYLLGVSPNPQQAGQQPVTGTGRLAPVATPQRPILNGNPRLAQANGQPILGSGFAPGSSPTTASNPATTGGVNLNSLVDPSLGGYGSLLQPFGQTFQAPTNVTEQNDPGYQFRLNQGMKALTNSASAKGTLLNGGTGKDITQFGQDYASNEYNNVYNRAYNQYATQYNQYQQHNTDVYNRLAGLSGVGQTAASTLGTLGQQTAQNVSNIDLTTGAQQGQDINNAGAARASGIVGAGNAYSSGLGSLASLGYLPYLQQMMQQQTTPTNWNDAAVG